MSLIQYANALNRIFESIEWSENALINWNQFLIDEMKGHLLDDNYD